MNLEYLGYEHMIGTFLENDWNIQILSPWHPQLSSKGALPPLKSLSSGGIPTPLKCFIRGKKKFDHMQASEQEDNRKKD